MSSATELEFSSKFLNLIKFVCSSEVYDSNYSKNLNELSQIPKFGFPSIANPPIFQRGSSSNESSAKPIKVTFKSLRQPKFSTSLEVESNVLVHKLKAKLIESLHTSDETGLGLSMEQIKLMLKTKTVHDGDSLDKYLDDEATEIGLTVLVSKAVSPSPVGTAASDVVKLEAETVSQLKSLSEDGWRKIYEVLKQEIKDEAVRDAYFEKLQNVVL